MTDESDELLSIDLLLTPVDQANKIDGLLKLYDELISQIDTLGNELDQVLLTETSVGGERPGRTFA